MQDKFFLQKVEEATDLETPRYMTDGAAGMDLHANVFDEETLESGEFKLIKTGIKISLPQGYEAQIRPRSGLAAKHGITVLNSPGTIDSDYRGEIQVILINHGKLPFIIKRGERIAQMVISEAKQVTFIETESLDETKRGIRGFGHTDNIK